MEENDKRILFFGLFMFALLILVYCGNTLYEVKQCKSIGGIYMEDGECYIPLSEEERQQIIRDGYRNISYSYGMPNFNFSLVILTK